MLLTVKGCLYFEGKKVGVFATVIPNLVKTRHYEEKQAEQSAK